MREFFESTKWYSKCLFFFWLVVGMGINRGINKSSATFAAAFLLPAVIIELCGNPVLLETDYTFFRFLNKTKKWSRVLVNIGFFFLALTMGDGMGILVILFVIIPFFVPAILIECSTNPVIKQRNTKKTKTLYRDRNSEKKVDSLKILENIRRAKAKIFDEEIIESINRIEFTTSKIFNTINKKPEKKMKLNTFLDYYLPTTQKFIDAYIGFEEVGIEGENLGQAKQRIKDSLGDVADGFERILDELYASDAMNIDIDVKVMEQMLEMDKARFKEDFKLIPENEQK